MATIKVTVTTTEGSNQFEEEIVLDLDKLRATPNPRQAITAHFMAMVRKTVAEVDPSINI